MKKAKNPVGAVQTTIQVLEGLKDLGGASVTELADHLDLTKGTVHNHVSTLIEHRFVTKEGDQYELGLRFSVFGEHVQNNNLLYQIGESEIKELARDTSEVVHLLTEQHGLGMRLSTEFGEDAIGGRFYVPERNGPNYLHCSAAGKAILAYLPQPRTEQIIDEYGLSEMTDSTITDQSVLFDELDTIRRQGYSLDDQEGVDGVRSVGAPVRDQTGRVLGAVSVSGPLTRIHDDRFRDVLPKKVKDTSRVIQDWAQLGDQPGDEHIMK